MVVWGNSYGDASLGLAAGFVFLAKVSMKKLFDSPIKKSENIKIKCPFCKEMIPSNALRCSHCTADLSGKEPQQDIENQLRRNQKAVIAAAIIGIPIFIFILIYIGLYTDVADPQSNSIKEAPLVVKKSYPETVGYLDSGGTIALFTHGIEPADFEKKFSEAVSSGDPDRVIAMQDFILETPRGTKVLLLGEEISFPPDELLGRKETLVDVKIQILDGPHKNKIGWANKSHLRFETNTGKSSTATPKISQPGITPSQKTSWQKVSSWQGSGDKELESILIGTRKLAFKVSWNGGPEAVYDEGDESPAQSYGIYQCENSACSLIIQTFIGAEGSGFVYNLNEFPAGFIIKDRPTLFKVMADTRTQWSVELQEFK